MLQPKVYIAELDKILEIKLIDFDNEEIEVYDEDKSIYRDFNFFEVEFIENTGFKDMNRNDIFVGDIIKHHNSCLRDRGKNFLVEKHDFDKRYTFSNLDEYYYDLDEEEAEFVEVIGNFYENKELLGNE